MKPDRSLRHRPHDRAQDRAHSTRLIVGLVIAAIGSILLAGNLGLIDGRYVLRHFWPVALIIIGALMIAHRESVQGRRWGWVWLVIGVWILANRLDLFHITLWQLFFPMMLLGVGGVLVWRALGSGQADVGKGPESSEFVRSFTLMSHTELRPISRPFRGGDLSAVMGGIDLDLTGSAMEGDRAVVEVFAFWGGIEIHVPPDWAVTSEVATLMAGFADKRRPSSVVPTRTLVIRGFVVMSGIDIKN